MPALLSKLFKNSAYLLVMNLGMLAALFVFSVLLARSLGKEALGLYTLFTATLMPFAYFVDLGQSTSLVQDIGRAPQASARIVHTSLALKALLSAIAAPALMLFSFLYFKQAEERQLFWVLGLLLLPRSLGATLEAAFRAHQQMVPPTAATLGSSALLLAGAWWLLATTRDLQTVLWFLVSVEIAKTALLAELYRRAHGWGLAGHRPLCDRALARELVVAALPFFLMGLLGILHYRLDIMLLAALRDNAEAGIYSAAGNFVKVLRVAPSVIVAAFFPAIAGMRTNSAAVRALARKTLWLQLVCSSALALAIFLFAEILIGQTYHFTEAVTVLRVQVWSIVPLALYATLVYVFFQADKPAWNMRIMAAAVVCNVMLNCLLIPRWGALAAAISSVASESLCCVLYFGCYFALQRSTLPESAAVERAADRVNSSAPCDTA